jgi:hypothetical protein
MLQERHQNGIVMRPIIWGTNFADGKGRGQLGTCEPAVEPDKNGSLPHPKKLQGFE